MSTTTRFEAVKTATSVLLPAGLIAAIVIGWRPGANAGLSFWLAFILTRPLGANLGDWLGFPADQRRLGLGVALTSVIFLTAILAPGQSATANFPPPEVAKFRAVTRGHACKGAGRRPDRRDGAGQGPRDRAERSPTDSTTLVMRHI